jgi:diguanylate cyclase (GGDEF)-like protein|nr:GGDEF domain-containing protein [Butyrivibrio sp.]
MYYSVIAALALIVNLILNWEYIKVFRLKVGTKDQREQIKLRYSHFLASINGFYIVEILWGLLYDYHDVASLFPVIYSITIFYFIFILLTMLTWTRYIVAYLDRDGRIRGKVLLYSTWVMFILGLLSLQLNRFYHFLFYFDENHRYVATNGRYLIFTVLLLYYVIISVYELFIALKSSGRKRIRYMAVAMSSMVFGVSMFLQILASFLPLYVLGLMVGTCVVHSYVEAGQKKEKKIQDHIASVMAQDYEAIYYFDIETGEYMEFARNPKYYSLDRSYVGKDFYHDAIANIKHSVYPEDKEYAESFFTKEAIRENIKDRRSFSFKFRVVVVDMPRFFLFTYMPAGDGSHIILYEKDIEDELRVEKEISETQKKTVTFGQIAESLASNYDAIYYVVIEDSNYVSFEINNIFGQLQVGQSGDDFFEECYSNIPLIIHEQDRDMVKDFLDKDKMITALETHKSYTLNYRIVVAGVVKYTRMIVRKSSDGTHFIIGVENIDEEVKKEQEHLMALKTEKELARRDELTGVKNKNAYKELEESVQHNMDQGMDYLPYAIVVCDANNLKKINDTLGHVAGDEYIKASAMLLCVVFAHSPVFRVGGDEFVAFVTGSDYANRNELLEKLRSQVLENQKKGEGAVIASGMAEYDSDKDKLVSDVFERADKEMYENKQKLKEMESSG